MVRPILSNRLSASDDGVLWLTVRWIKMPLGMEIGFSPGDIVLDGNQALPTETQWRIHGRDEGAIAIPRRPRAGRNKKADTTARADNFRRDLSATKDFNLWLLGKPVSDCMFAVIKMEFSGKTVYGPVLKTTQLSAHAQNHASPERCRKSYPHLSRRPRYPVNRFKFWQSDSI